MKKLMDKIAYKIEDKNIWENARLNGVYKGSLVDKADGFIHLSAKHQVKMTFDKYFKDKSNLIIATIDLEKLGSNIKWEASRNNDLFPHIYSDLDFSAVLETKDIIDNLESF